MAMTSTARLYFVRKALVVGAWGVLWSATSQVAYAYSDRVTQSCGSDYQAFCSQHAPESSALRYCFEASRNKLSQQCINALVDAGEVPRKYLDQDSRK